MEFLIPPHSEDLPLRDYYLLTILKRMPQGI